MPIAAEDHALTPQQVNAVKAGYQEEEELCDRLAATSAPDFVVDLLGREANHLHKTIERQLPLRGCVRALRVELWKRRPPSAS